MTIRALPSTQQNELRILNHYLFDPRKPNILQSPIHGAHFLAIPVVCEVWDRIREMQLAGEAWDMLRVFEQKKIGLELLPKDFTHPDYLCFSIYHVEQAMLEAYAKHKLAIAARKLSGGIESGELGIGEALGHLDTMRELGGASSAQASKTSAELNREISEDMFNGRKAGVRLLPMPMDLSDWYQGWRVGKSFYWGAKTSCYKSTGLAMSAEVVARAGHSVLFWTLEDSAKDLQHRLLVRNGLGLTYSELDSHWDKDNCGEVSAKMMTACTETSELPIHYREDPLYLQTMASEISRGIARTNAKMVCLDFVNLIDSKESMPEHERIAMSSRILARLAKSLDIVILAAIQFTQDSTRRMDEQGARPPGIGDIRGGSALAQAAFGVLMNYVPIDEMGDPKGNDLTLLVRKWKRGKRRSFMCKVDGGRDFIWRTDAAPMLGTVIPIEKKRQEREAMKSPYERYTPEPKDDD